MVGISQYLPTVAMQVQNRLKKNELAMTDLLADAGYSNGSNYYFLEQEKLRAVYLYLESTNLKLKASLITKKKMNIAVQWTSPYRSKDFIQVWTAVYLETTGQRQKSARLAR
jgi:hypothetical protein